MNSNITKDIFDNAWLFGKGDHITFPVIGGEVSCFCIIGIITTRSSKFTVKVYDISNNLIFEEEITTAKKYNGPIGKINIEMGEHYLIKIERSGRGVKPVRTKILTNFIHNNSEVITIDGVTLCMEDK